MLSFRTVFCLLLGVIFCIWGGVPEEHKAEFARWPDGKDFDIYLILTSLFLTYLSSVFDYYIADYDDIPASFLRMLLLIGVINVGITAFNGEFSEGVLLMTIVCYPIIGLVVMVIEWELYLKSKDAKKLIENCYGKYISSLSATVSFEMSQYYPFPTDLVIRRRLNSFFAWPERIMALAGTSCLLSFSVFTNTSKLIFSNASELFVQFLTSSSRKEVREIIERNNHR